MKPEKLEAIALARDERLVATPAEDNCSWTQMQVLVSSALQAQAIPGCDVASLLKFKRDKNAFSIACGSRKDSNYETKTGLRCNFLINLEGIAGRLRVTSYTMHVASDRGCPPMFRWEYQRKRKVDNSGEEKSAVAEPLAHMHPGVDHIRVPSPVLTALELVAMLVTL